MATFLTLSLAVLMAAAAASAGSFSVELIHRDSPKSPMYNPAATPVDRARAAARRSAYNRQRLSATDDIASAVVSDKSEYLMEFQLGTPPFKIMAIADTGSDLIWTNCNPCSQCFDQVQPLFDPRNSTTFAPISCQSESCEALPGHSCGANSGCQYHYSYGDKSNVDGAFATETFTFGSGTKVSNVAFGCNSQSTGSFSKDIGGLVGLGAGHVSLVSQFSPFLDSNYFSYCLVPIMDDQSSSKLVFGSAGKVTGSSKVTIPMSVDKSFYALSLEEISVDGGGSVSVGSSSSPQLSNGNMIIDSGTTLTLLLGDVVSSLVEQVRKVVDFPQVNDPEGVFQLCFQVSQESDQEKLPTLTFKFAGGASVKLSPLNMFLAVEAQMVCLAVAATTADVGVQILGNVAQQNFHVGYDLDNKELSFDSTDCTKL